MKTAGIIVEYNPLHHGHMHHLKKTREITGADVIIAVMSGNVVQRGEFAITDKFTRTEWALEAGIDLVVELPAFFTLQNADLFAWAAVSILDALGCETLVFGSESGDVHALKAQSELMRTDTFNERINALMQEGHSYPSANQIALETLSGKTFTQTPNDILGVQYLNAIHDLRSPMEPRAIERVESGYYEAYDQNRSIQSATSVRQRLLEGKAIASSVPEHVYPSLQKGSLNTLSDYDPVIRYLLAIHSKESLARIFSFEEGLESWLLRHRDATTHEALLKSMATRRYTQARIKRSIMHMMLNTTKEEAPPFNVPYIRILGMRDAGQVYLNRIKHTLSVPLVSKVGRMRDPLLEFELKTSRLYAVFTDYSVYEREFDPVIIL